MKAQEYSPDEGSKKEKYAPWHHRVALFWIRHREGVDTMRRDEGLG